MTLDDLDKIDFTRRNILVIGKPGSGKTHFSKALSFKYWRHELIHTDKYLKLYDDVGRQIYAAFEDADHYKHTIIEGILGYELLLEGYKKQSYFPDVVLECQVSAGHQRLIYLNERDPAKLRYLKHFERINQAKLNEYYNIVPVDQQPRFITYNNEFNATKVKDK
jgi:hypothetical protein